jgi:TPP-dependent pyruvate/acetoin dehydrogenase alpha subunit
VSADPIELYRVMARIRHFETEVGTRFRHGDIHGFVHVSLGQEAVAAGACAALRPDDYITTTHRGHGHCVAKGASVEAMMAELFGRATGICGGKGGSMHIADPRLGILGANGVVGAGIPLAVGAALRAKLTGSERVAVAFFGEGAVHTGAFHEGLTLAANWNVPVIFLCENNGYAEFTQSDRWSGPRIHERAPAYGIDSGEVDGTDAVAVNLTMERIVDEVRNGGAPYLLEARTTRFSGHYEGDAQQYRDDSDSATFAERDPLLLLAAKLDDATVATIDAEASAEIEEAVELALQAPYPPLSAALDDIYA